MVGKVPETRDKSEDLPRIQSFTYAPRIGRVRQNDKNNKNSWEYYSMCSYADTCVRQLCCIRMTTKILV